MPLTKLLNKLAMTKRVQPTQALATPADSRNNPSAIDVKLGNSMAALIYSSIKGKTNADREWGQIEEEIKRRMLAINMRVNIMA